MSERDAPMVGQPQTRDASDSDVETSLLDDTARKGGPDWAWLRRLRANPRRRRLYRIAVAVLGTVVTVVGLILVPLPGPGWLIVFLGLGIWASEFAWAQRVLAWARARVDAWTDWLKHQPPWVKALVSLATLALLAMLAYAYLKWQGAPGLLPDGIQGWLTRALGLPD